MAERTQKQIAVEIKAIQACKSYIPARTMFGDDNHGKLDLQAKYLLGQIDVTDDDEWNEYTDDEQSAILEAKDWAEGQTDESPSSGWNSYKPKAGKPKKTK